MSSPCVPVVVVVVVVVVVGERERTPAGQAEHRTVSLGRTGGRRDAASQPASLQTHITASLVSSLLCLSTSEELDQS